MSNVITTLLLNDKTDSFSILAYVDFDEILTTNFVNNFTINLVNQYPILKKTIIKKNNLHELQEIVSFDINKIIKIKYSKYENFNHFIKNLMNEKFSEYKFKIVVYIDKNLKKSRFYFKIHHSYADGYMLSNMLMSNSVFNKKGEYVLPVFKRKTTILSTIYHYTISTFVLMMLNLWFLLKGLTVNKVKRTSEIECIVCKSFSLNDIKQMTKKNKYTINDFLYAVMIKTDYLYTKKKRMVNTTSPINISKLDGLNNMCPIFNTIYNASDDKTLMNKIHSTFNRYKYSLFMPIFNFIINNIPRFINIPILLDVSDKIMDNSDYVFTNIIGPCPDCLNVNISDAHFIVTPKNGEIVYNIISSGENINLVCSFKQGVIDDVKRYEACIYEAYDSLCS